jgi:hypothetical protein
MLLRSGLGLLVARVSCLRLARVVRSRLRGCCCQWLGARVPCPCRPLQARNAFRSRHGHGPNRIMQVGGWCCSGGWGGCEIDRWRLWMPIFGTHTVPGHLSKHRANVGAVRSRPIAGPLPVKVQLPATWCVMAAPGVRRKRPTRLVISAGRARFDRNGLGCRTREAVLCALRREGLRVCGALARTGI